MLARLAFLAALALSLAACGGGEKASAPEQAAPPTATTVALPGETTSFALFYLDGERLEPATADAAGEATAQEVVEALVENAQEEETAIPAGTTVNGVTSGGGTAVADLSAEFASGGGSLSMQARVAQLVFTLTQWPWIERVTIRLDGEDVEAIGGEGVPARGLTRADFGDFAPPILVDAPAAGATVTSPLEVAGSASVFEANVSLRLETSDGAVLEETFATATEGAPGRGTFATEIAFDVEERTEAVLVAFEAAADDSGAERHAVRVPVVLEPQD